MTDPASQRLILLHGWLGDPADFAGLGRDLPQLTALPLPGHGGLELRPGTTTDEALDDLAERIVEAAAGKPYVLGGYSMGGRAAAWLTATGRARPDALVLIAASPGLPDEAARAERLAVDRARADELRSGPFEDFLERWYRLPLFAGLRDRDEFPRLLERRLRRDPEQVARALELLSVGRQPDLAKHDFETEVMYIAGAQDRKYSALRDGWTGSRAVLVGDAGHAVHIEQPAAVAQAIRNLEWLR